MRMSKAQARELGQALMDAAESHHDQLQIMYIDYTHIVAIPTLNGEHCMGGGIIVEHTIGVDDRLEEPLHMAEIIPLAV